MESIDRKAITSSAITIAATTPSMMMRARMRGSGVTASRSRKQTVAETAKWTQAPREKLNSKPPNRAIITARSKSLMPRVINPIMSNSRGKIRNGP